jgi:hypothetical protein
VAGGKEMAAQTKRGVSPPRLPKPICLARVAAAFLRLSTEGPGSIFVVRGACQGGPTRPPQSHPTRTKPSDPRQPPKSGRPVTCTQEQNHVFASAPPPKEGARSVAIAIAGPRASDHKEEDHASRQRQGEIAEPTPGVLAPRDASITISGSQFDLCAPPIQRGPPEGRAKGVQRGADTSRP